MTTIITTRENPPLSADEVMTRARAAVVRVDGPVAEVAITKRWGVANMTVVHVAQLDAGEVDEYGHLHKQIIGEVE